MNRPAPWHSLIAGVLDRRPFDIGDATVDPVSRDARWRGGEERLQPQTLKVLLTLVSHRGEVVTRDELIQLCWGGRIVGDDVINRSISLLRHFADRAGGFEIKTVPRTGYRLVESRSPASASTRRWRIALAAAAMTVLGSIGAWAWLDNRVGSQGQPPAPSITVVPFSAVTNDPLSRQLARASPGSIERMMSESGFAVMRADAGGQQPPLTDYFFRGSVTRSAASVDATVQLVSSRDGTITFAHDFSAPLNGAADLPDRIGAAMAADLAWTGAEMVLDPRQHFSPAITSELMKSLSLQIEQRDYLRAYQLSRHAASLAPNSAFAQLSLSIEAGFAIDSLPRDERDEALALARRASERALAMAPQFADVYIPWCQLHSPVRMAECEARLHKASAIDSSSSFVFGYLSALYYNAGRTNEALQLARQSLANDPYKPAKLSRAIRLLEATGHDEEAEHLYRDAERLFPDDHRFASDRIQGIAESGNYERLAAAVDRIGDAASVRALLNARRAHDVGRVRQACDSNDIAPLALRLCVPVLADLGDPNAAYALAARLYPAWGARPGANEDEVWLNDPDGFANALLTGPAGRSLRSDPRFIDLAAKLGLMAYWRSGRLPDFCTKSREPLCARVARSKTDT